MNERLLEMKNISVHYGGIFALRSVDMDLRRGEIAALMGPNGAGKSTILKVIFGLVPFSSGEILWKGKPLKPSPFQSVQMGMGYVPQGRRVFSRLSVLENLEIAGYIIREKRELLRRIEEVLTIFPVLKERLHDSAGKLSGGQQQMLALGRGLMVEPELLLLDEPTLGLAPKIVHEIFEKIREIHQRKKTTILIVEHNISSLLKIVQRAYVLQNGSIIAQGDSKKLREERVVERVLLGQDLTKT